MSPEEYAALLTTGKVDLRRDRDGNFLYEAYRTSTAVLPRNIIEQLQADQNAAIQTHEQSMAAFNLFITALKNAK